MKEVCVPFSWGLEALGTPGGRQTMFVIRFSYFLMPANRNKAIEMIRQEVEAAKTRGIESRLLIPLSRDRGGAALEYEIEVS